MHKGAQRFNFYFSQLETLLKKAELQKNPALWLYANNARTPLFMLESLAKMYAELHNRNKFLKIKAQFKLLEDVLGAIDYYDVIAKDFIKRKNIPTTITSYLQAQTREKIQSLNELLIEKKWVGTGKNRINKIQEKLKNADWQDEADEVDSIKSFYGEAIYLINEFVQAKNFHFLNMEADVHELRRKLRWLSIYPQSLQGCIQLTENKNIPKHLAKYLTKEITTSAFNKMPDAGDTKHFLLLEKNYFFSLSWMIAELGKLKDTGLEIIALKEAIQQTEGLTEKDAFSKAYQLSGKKQNDLKTLLTTAEKITSTYFNEQNLEHLIVGCSKTQ